MNRRTFTRLFAAASIIASSVFVAPVNAHAEAELNIYTGVPRDQAEVVLEHFKNAYGKPVKFNILYGPTEEIIAQVGMEIRSGKSKADVLWTDMPQIQALGRRNEGLYHTIESKHFDDLLDQVRVGEYQKTAPVGMMLYVIGFNTGQISKEDAPTSFAQMLDPKWANKIVMANPQSSAGVHNLFWMVTQHLGGKEPYGWDFFSKLKDLNPQYVSAHGPIRDLLVSGERPLGFQLSFYLTDPIARGEKVWWNWPEEGVPAGQFAVSVIDNGKDPEPGLAFADWLLSPEGQKVTSDIVSLVPVNTKVEIKFPDGSAPADLNLVPVDTVYITENRPEIIREFQNAAGVR
ncbi:hypothetical protein DKP76_04265 [Falsochrobactrum shanghaiense]|uniref:ABC transporter substrate-binding protein n=1 Tax=Falsochrobactrum shanghaiense TaxID=2201899 RepID=A0A316JA15_9HYPH|nr:extracellular solute-binding protein [Falsochrobactrum shanghaiense]PWL18324.1 hypothetical protein DKP76_04265 [Falsochrobactrum shanghaiense]